MSPRNRARTPFTTCFSGLMSDSRCSQVGPSSNNRVVDLVAV